VCGIYGAFSTDAERPTRADVLERMAHVLGHRGPDGGGSHLAGPFGMGMCRLSIVDLASGDQPISNEDGTIWVVFNGEIYNYRELTADLITRGHRFATASDSEVLVHLYEEHAERCVEHLRGMFAFAIWDGPHRELLLGRDRLGIYGSDPLSILDGEAKVSPGHTITVRAGGPAAPRRYWQPTDHFKAEGAPGNEEQLADDLRRRLEEAVRFHLVSDVPVGASLSGGVDSTAVISIMARASRQPITTFSVGFREDRYNELPHARQVARAYGTEHHELVAEPSDLKLLKELLSSFDEPFADPTAIPTYLVSRLARQHVKVVLSGDGGDELFAGYDRYVIDHRRRHLGLLGDVGLGVALRAVSAVLPVGGGKNTLYNLSLPRLQRYIDSISLFPQQALRDILGGEAPRIDIAPLSDRNLDALSQLQDLDLKATQHA
jgi:asparagine synthase (glutamine-hydrolysing)